MTDTGQWFDPGLFILRSLSIRIVDTNYLVSKVTVGRGRIGIWPGD